MFKLYYYPNNASLAPHFLLRHVRANYELVLVDRKSDSHKSEEYLRLNPAGRIPVLVADGQAIFESPAICIHIAELHPDYALIPPIGDPNRPLFFQWLAYLNNTLQADLMVRFYPYRHTTDINVIANIEAAQEERITEALSVLNAQLADNEYLLGEKLTACDYFFFMLALWSLSVKRSPLTFGNLAGYLKRMSENPVVKSVCKAEGIDLSRCKGD